MNRSLLVQLIGFPATLLHGDTLVLDRWRWLVPRLRSRAAGLTLLDIGCGSGAFTIGAARLGYKALGLSWDQRNQSLAEERARLCGATDASFEVQDVRTLDRRTDLVGKFDVVLCCENIEHILDDAKLMGDMSACLKPGGRLLLTTPNESARPITADDLGPFSTVEDGGHVRRGYSPERLKQLSAQAGLSGAQISYCSGFVSQKTTFLMRVAGRVSGKLAWALTLPLRPLAPLLDERLGRITKWPAATICLEAARPT